MREELPGEEHQSYHSLAGFIIHVLGRIPVESDQVQAQGYVFEVVDMDLHRIDKVLVYPVSEDEGEAEEDW
jgi:putative hemolysin